MVRTLLRTVLLIIIVAAIAAFFFGYRMANREDSEPSYTVGTSGRGVDVDTAREKGAEIGERVAAGANEAQRLAASAALTAKIKSKMALDDTIQATRIDVDTSDGVVTLHGSVSSPSQRERALQLARETDGVTSVVDRLEIR
jgi:hypothetical protein